MLRQFGEDIWIADGPSICIAGFAYPTLTAVIRLRDGGLFIWSPTALSAELRASVDALGPACHIIAPNTLHHRFIGEWQQAYPQATIHGLPAMRRKRADLSWSNDLGNAPDPAWAADIDQILMDGNLITPEVVFFHRRSRTTIFTDLIQNFEPGWVSGWRALVARIDQLTAPQPTVPRKFRLAFRNKASARAALERILQWPTEKLLAAHCPPVIANGRDTIAHAFAWLLRR